MFSAYRTNSPLNFSQPFGSMVLQKTSFPLSKTVTPVYFKSIHQLLQPVVVVHLVDSVISEYVELMVAPNPASRNENIPVENYVGYQLS